MRRKAAWGGTGNSCFPTAARVDGQWWVLRINSFPDYPIWTLFVGGERRFDVDKAPPEWGKPTSNELPPLTDAEAEDALAAVIEFDA